MLDDRKFIILNFLILERFKEYRILLILGEINIKLYIGNLDINL